MEDKLLYELEYEISELRRRNFNDIRYNEMTIKELLDLGFDNTFIIVGDNCYNLGYKWKIQDSKIKEINYGYESSDFGELNEKQLSCIVEYCDYELSNNYGFMDYMQITVKLVNEEDKKYFEEVKNV